MYNNPTAKQLAHLVRKKPKGFVYQFGNTNMRIPMTYYKAHLPKLEHQQIQSLYGKS